MEARKQIPSLKNEWSQYKQDRFAITLDTQGWKIRRQLKDSNLWEKGNVRIETDDFGLFLWELKPPQWERTEGLSDDRIDIGYLPGRDPKILRFKDHPKGIKQFDLATGRWVK